MKRLTNGSSASVASAPIAGPQADQPPQERNSSPIPWRPDCPKMSREELRQIVMEVLG